MFKRSIKLLEIPPTFSKQELKKAYYKKAILYHPDKNKDDDAGEKFKEIGAAYTFLQKAKKMNLEPMPESFRDIVEKCLHFLHSDKKWESLFVQTTFESILKNYKSVSIKIFELMKKERAIEVYNFLRKHNEIFTISKEILDQMEKIIKKKFQIDYIFVLNPTLKDMLQDQIFKLDFNHATYYVPLWHHEICFDVSGKTMLVKCVAEVNKDTYIDNNNNIFYKIHGKMNKVLESKKLSFTLGGKEFEIPANKLTLSKKQYWTFREKGLLKVDENDMYNECARADIYVEISFD